MILIGINRSKMRLTPLTMLAKFIILLREPKLTLNVCKMSLLPDGVNEPRVLRRKDASPLLTHLGHEACIAAVEFAAGDL